MVEALAVVVGGLDVAVLSGADAAELTELFARGERLSATAKAMTAQQAGECQHWARTGARSPEHSLASLSGESEGSARTSLVVAEQIEARPELAAACVAGQLSVAQAVRSRRRPRWTRRRRAGWWKERPGRGCGGCGSRAVKWSRRVAPRPMIRPGGRSFSEAGICGPGWTAMGRAAWMPA